MQDIFIEMMRMLVLTLDFVSLGSRVRVLFLVSTPVNMQTHAEGRVLWVTVGSRETAGACASSKLIG